MRPDRISRKNPTFSSKISASKKIFFWKILHRKIFPQVKVSKKEQTNKLAKQNQTNLQKYHQ